MNYLTYKHLAQYCLESYDDATMAAKPYFHRIDVESNVAFWTHPTPHDLLLVFRGSDDDTDWQENFNRGRVRMNDLHAGWRKLSQQIWPTIHELLKAQDPDTKLTVTGHSLGGVLATLTNFYASMNGIDFDTVGLFGTPSPFSRIFTDVIRDEKWAKNTVSFVYGNDAAPRILDNSYIGQQIHIGPKRCFKWRKAIKDHDLSGYIDALDKLHRESF